MTPVDVDSTVINLISRNKRQLAGFVVGANDFARAGKLGLVHTIGHILFLSCQRNQNGYEITSQNYFSEMGDAKAAVCRASLCEARQKIHWSAFDFLLRTINADHAGSLGEIRWHGHIVRAIDGSFLSLPATEEVLESFPRRPSPQIKTHYPKGILVTAMNVFTGQPTNAAISSYQGSERASLLEMLADFNRGDCLLLDRGFEGLEYFCAIEERGLFFVSRLRTDANGLRKEVRDFLGSGKRSAVVELSGKVNGEERRIKVRLIRGKQDRKGQPILLATNLFGRRSHSRNDIMDLYLMRWRVETLYFRAKKLLCIESFHAKTLNGVLQEIWANLVVLAITALLARRGQIYLKHQERVPNFKAVSELVRRHFHIFVRLRRGESRNVLPGMIEQIVSILCQKQPGRHNPRVSKQPHVSWVNGLKNRLIDKYKLRAKRASKSCA